MNTLRTRTILRWIGLAVLALVPLIAVAAGPEVQAPPLPLPAGIASAPLPETPPSARATWAKTFGGSWDEDECTLIKENGDGTYFVSGWTISTPERENDLLLMKVDGTGSILWQRAYGSSNFDDGRFLTTPDGGFAVVFYTSSGAPLPIMKLDANGDISWQQAYGASGSFREAQVLKGGNFLLSGAQWSLSPTPQGTAHLMKLDSTGSILWQKQYSSPTMLFAKAYVTPLHDGAFMADLVWLSASYEQKRVLLKLDPDGAILWQKLYTVQGGKYSGSLSPTPDGGYILGGSFAPASGKKDLLIAELDPSGNITWQKTCGTAGDDTLEFIFPTDGAYLFSGWANPDNAGASLVGKVDGEGNVLWAQTFGGGSDYLFAGGGETGGGHLLQGLIRNPGRESFDSCWVVKVDDGGTIQWQRAYGGSEGGGGTIQRTGDGGLLLTGDTRSAGMGQRDLWVWSLDSQGQLGFPCPLLRDTAITPVEVALNAGTGTLTAVDSDVVAEDSSFTGTPSSLAVYPMGLAPQEVCEGVPIVTAQAAAEPTSGIVPLTVHFSGGATGGHPPYTYSWDFGDGSSLSSEQNPTHIYEAPGAYSVDLWVTDAYQAMDWMGLTIYGAGECALNCWMHVPLKSTTGVPIPFLSEYDATDCPGEPAFVWTFGDGTDPGSTEDVTHAYAATGTYAWAYSVTLAGHECSRQGTIVIDITLPGDCDGSGTVSIGEVQKAINMFLDLAPVDCDVDCNGDATVSIGEVQKVINGFLGLLVSC